MYEECLYEKERNVLPKKQLKYEYLALGKRSQTSKDAIGMSGETVRMRKEEGGD